MLALYVERKAGFGSKGVGRKNTTVLPERDATAMEHTATATFDEKTNRSK